MSSRPCLTAQAAPGPLSSHLELKRFVDSTPELSVLHGMLCDLQDEGWHHGVGTVAGKRHLVLGFGFAALIVRLAGMGKARARVATKICLEAVLLRYDQLVQGSVLPREALCDQCRLFPSCREFGQPRTSSECLFTPHRFAYNDRRQTLFRVLPIGVDEDGPSDEANVRAVMEGRL